MSFDASDVKKAAVRVARQYGDREIQRDRRAGYRSRESGNGQNMAGLILQDLGVPFPSWQHNEDDFTSTRLPDPSIVTSGFVAKLNRVRELDQAGANWHVIATAA